MNRPFGEELVNTDELLTNTQTASMVHTQVEQYVEKGASQLANALSTPQAQKVLEDLGLKTYVQDLNKQKIINVLAAYGMWSVIRGLKNNFVKVGVLGLGIWVVSQNSEKIKTAFNQISSSNEFVV